MDQPVVPMQSAPSVTANAMPAPTPVNLRPSRPGLKIAFVLLAIAVIMSSSYAGAAFYFKLWPFQSGPLNKQMAFAGLFAKIQTISSATYEANLGVKADTREVGATAFVPAAFPEFADEQKMYDNDANRVRDLNTIQTALYNSVAESLRTPGAALSYPEKLSDLPSLAGKDLTSYQYVPTALRDNYTLTMIFETDAAIKAIQGSLYGDLKKSTEINGKTVIFNKDSGDYFYFYSQPQKPYWVTAMESGSDTYLMYTPSDFNFNLNVGGTSQKNQTSTPDASFHLGGDASFGDFNVAADVELRKKGDVYYGEITKFPSLFLDLSAIKNKWVKVTPEDLISYGDLPYIANFVGDKQKQNSKNLEQVQTIFKTMDEDKVLSVDYNLPDVMVGDRPAYQYAVTYDETKVVPWYEHLSKVMKDTYGDTAIVKLDETSLKYMKTDSFQKYLAFIKNNTTMHILVDKMTGFPVKIDYRFRLVPGDSVVKLKDKQITLSMSVSLSNINTPVAVEVPKDAITFEGAQLALTGQTHEVYQFNKQRQNVETIQSALSSYHSYTGLYPDTLDQLTTPRGQLQKASTTTSGSGATLEFPAGFADLGSTSSDYEKQLALQPFLKTLPKDVFTGTAYEYAKTVNPDSFTLKYSMTIPPKPKTADVGGSGFFGGQGFGVNDAVAFVNGINTATSKNISEEAKTALKVDTDGDGLPDIVEAYYGSDPNKKDTDGDGYSDGDEVAKGYDPNGPGKLNYGDIWYKPYVYTPPVYNNTQSQANSVTAGPACRLEGQSVSASQKCCYGSEIVKGTCAKSKPDLRIASIITAGTAFKVRICNDGKVPAASPSFTTTANGKSSKLIVPDLSAGECETDQTWGYSYFGIGDTWKGVVEVTADKENLISESNEKNNTLKQTMTVTMSFGCAENSSGAGTANFYSPEPATDAPAIIVTAPKHGDTLMRNKPYIIAWDTKNFTAKTINIYLDDLCGTSSFIARGIANEGNYPWNVDTIEPIGLSVSSMPVPPTKYLLVITSNGFDNTANQQIVGYAGYITIK